MRRTRASVLALIAVAALIASCGSNSDGSDGSSTGPADSTTSDNPDPTAEDPASESDPNSSNGGSNDDPSGEMVTLDGTNLAFANLTDAGELTQTTKAGIEAAAKKVNASLQSYDNKFDASATLENAKLIAAESYDVVLEWNPVASTAKAVEREFKQADIKCIAVNTEGEGYCPWFNADIPKLCYESGVAMAHVAADRGWTGKDTTVILIEASQMGETPNQCLGQFYFALQEELPDFEPIASPKDITLTTTKIGETGIQVDTGNGLRDEAYQGVKNTLQSLDQDRNVIVYGLSDDAAFGGWRAVQEADRVDNALTGGLGGDPAALNELRTNPGWVLQGDLFMGLWGEYLMAMSAAILNDVEMPDLTTSPLAVLTKDFSVDDTMIAPVDTFYGEGDTIASTLPALVEIETGNIGPKDGTKGNAYLADVNVLQQFNNVAGL